MNNIVQEYDFLEAAEFTIDELCKKNFKDDKSAFIGRIESNETGLHLIHWGGIIRADNPQITWEPCGAKVRVIKFVDIDITARERKSNE